MAEFDLNLVPTQTWLDYLKAEQALSSDVIPPQALNYVYVPGLSSGMIMSAKPVLDDMPEIGDLFKLVAQYGQTNQGAFTLMYNGSDGRGIANPTAGGAWVGREEYERRFRDLWRESVTLEPIDPAMEFFETRQFNAHTVGEMRALVHHMKEQNQRQCVIFSVRWHLTQLALALVKEMADAGHFFTAYFVCPPTDWRTQMVGSQGLQAQSTASEEQDGYLPKVLRQQHEGFTATFPQLFWYLAHRAQMAEFDFEIEEIEPMPGRELI